MTAAAPREGLSVTHRRYVPASHAHYGGNLVDGAYVLGLFGDVATETGHPHRRRRVPVRLLLRRPVPGPGAWLETSWRQRRSLTRAGRRSRELAFEARVVCRAEPERGQSASRVLDEPLIVVTATGTIVVPAGD